jgi:hypothetical protein
MFSKPADVRATVSLKEFIASTIQQILEGVTTAQAAAPAGAQVAPHRSPLEEGAAKQQMLRSGEPLTHVEFDVTLGNTEGTATSGKIGVLLGTIGLGSEGKSQQGTTALTRIKFSIPVALPSQPRR